MAGRDHPPRGGDRLGAPRQLAAPVPSSSGCWRRTRRGWLSPADVASPEHPLPPATAETLTRRAGGHPLFLRELVLAASRGEDLDEPPESVEQLVAVRLDALPAEDRSLPRRAAGARQHVPAAVAHPDARHRSDPGRRPTPCSARSARLDGFVVDEGGGQLAFRHAVHREVAYAGLPFRTRRSLHVRAAEILEQSRPRSATGPSCSPSTTTRVAGSSRPGATPAGPESGRTGASPRPQRPTPSRGRPRRPPPGHPAYPWTERARDLESLGDAQFLCGRSAEADVAYHHAGRALGPHAPFPPPG